MSSSTGFGTLRALAQVLRDAKRPSGEIDRLARKRLRGVLVSAYQYVPYYRQAMQEVGYHPVHDFQGPEDLARLPITTKEVLKARPPADLVMAGADLSRCFVDTTSGSTGIPLAVYRSPWERAVQVAKWLRVLFANGYAPRDRVMSFTSPHRLGEGKSPLQRFGVFRREAVDYLLTPGEMADRLLDTRPHVLYGNRSHLSLLAQELRARQIRPSGLKLLIGTGEVFCDSDRPLYREQFGTSLVESYGSVEMGVMAYETQAHDGLHLCTDLTYFEFVDAEGRPVAAGESGRVIVTDLTGEVMPFIRYDQGDLATWEPRPGPEGSVSRSLTRIVGREEDYVAMPDGTQRPYHDFYEIMASFPDLVQFRFVQQALDRFQVLVVCEPDYLSTIRQGLIERLRNQFLPSVRFEIVRVEELAPDPSGKLRILVSEIAS